MKERDKLVEQLRVEQKNSKTVQYNSCKDSNDKNNSNNDTSLSMDGKQHSVLLVHTDNKHLLASPNNKDKEDAKKALLGNE